MCPSFFGCVETVCQHAKSDRHFFKQAPGKAKTAAAKEKENAAPNGAAARVLADMQSLEYEANMKEAAARGYGKLYAVFGGGRDGLHACAAGAPYPACKEGHGTMDASEAPSTLFGLLGIVTQ